MVESMMMITNVQVSSNLGCTLDVMELGNKCLNVIYDPARFSALRMEHRTCTSKCLVFKTGYVCCHGKSYKEARSNLRKYARIIQKKGYHIRLGTIRVVNVSFMHNLGGPIEFSSVRECFPQLEYEPEIFPSGASLKLGDIHVNIFKSGKVTAVGLKNETVPQCLKNLISSLERLVATRV